MRISDWSSDVCSSDLLDAGDRSAPVGRDLLAGHGRSSAKPGGVPAAAALEIPPLQGRAPRPLNPMQEPEMNRILSDAIDAHGGRSEEHTSELQSLMRNSYAVFCLKKKKKRH